MDGTITKAAGAALLARSLEGNSALRTLLLDANGIGEMGARNMIKPLQGNAALLRLGLTGNGISTATGDAIRSALACNRSTRDVVRLEVSY